MMNANFKTAAALMPAWKQKLEAGIPPTLYPVGLGGFTHVRIGPGLLTLVSGPPGLGKTALVNQWVVDALRASPELRALVVNVESAPEMLLDRQLSRLSGINASLIRDRATLDPERLQFGFDVLDTVAERLAFVNSPYTLEHVAAVVDDFHPGLIVIDYTQRVPPSGTAGPDLRQTVTATMQYLRRFTDEGLAVIAVAALARGKDKSGSTYSGAGLASFRESSELEYGADDAYLLMPAETGAEFGAMKLHHLKARHGEQVNLLLQFDGAHQSFGAVDVAEPANDGLTPDVIAELWAGNDLGGDA